MAKPKDPYTGILNDALSVVIPLVAAPSTKKRNLVHFFVPAETTSVDFGAGAIPGIRMITDNHVHLTARTPSTTLSLGKAAGDGVSGPDGINFVTDGNKTESVKLKTWETYTQDAILTYSAKKNEDVTGAWEEKGHGTKTETVTGLWQQTAQTDMMETVTGKKTETFGTHDVTVNGPVTIVHKATKTEQILGALTQTFTGPHTKATLDSHTNFAYGIKSDTYVGAQAAIVVGAQITSNTGVQATTNTGATVTMYTGASLTVTAPVTVTMNAINTTVNGLNIAQSLIELANKPMSIEDAILKLIK